MSGLLALTLSLPLSLECEWKKTLMTLRKRRWVYNPSSSSGHRLEKVKHQTVGRRGRIKPTPGLQARKDRKNLRTPLPTGRGVLVRFAKRTGSWVGL